jgi:hypothetical protein
MRKTISLKVTSQEEEVISSMRKKGISTSAFIRKALWNYIQENDAENGKKVYKEANPVNHLDQERVNQDDRKVYNAVNPVNQKVNHDDDFLREKVVYQPVNQVNQSHTAFLDQYIHQLHTQIQQLESELHDWKMRYAIETQYWKETYQSLQTEYQNHVKDSTKRIDDKFDRIMFYFEESRKSPPQTLEVPLQSDNQTGKQKKKWSSQMVRM